MLTWHKTDAMSIFVTSGQNCEPGVPIAEANINEKNKVGMITAEQKSFIQERLRVSDALSNPTARSVCVLIYCQNQRTACLIDVDASIYDCMCII